MSHSLKATRTLILFALAALFIPLLAGAQSMGKEDLKKLIAGAMNPADHERIAKHYDAKAVQLEADAKEHEELASEYKRNPTGHEQKHPMSGQTAAHCKLFADRFREAAKQARQLAVDHRQMAKTVK